MGRVHVGRQPIFDRDRGVLGYELFFRAGEASTAAGSAGDAATTGVILDTFTQFGLDRLVGERLAFVNVTRAFVVGAIPLPFPPDVAVLEIVPGVAADAETLAGAARLVATGYRLALDGFAFEPDRMDFLSHASYVKLDVAGVEPAVLQERFALAKRIGVSVVATRVESAEQLECATALGADYFQGFHLVRPDVVSTPSVSPSQLASLQLVSTLTQPDVSVEDVEAVVRLDLALNYRVLRAANSAATGVNRRIDSIRDALVLLGLQRLRSWLLLMVLADQGGAHEEQLSSALTRARTCELLAASGGEAKPATAFVAGLLSSLESVLGLPMPVLLERLPLTDELSAALGQRSGPLGRILAAVVAHEDGDVATVEELGLDLFDVSRAYLEAAGWSLQTVAGALGSR